MKSFRKHEKAQRIITAVLMGANYVQTMIPVGIAIAQEYGSSPNTHIAHATASKPYQYDLLPTVAGYIDDIVFSKAYAEASPLENAVIVGSTVQVQSGAAGGGTASNCSIGTGGKLILDTDARGQGGYLISSFVDGGVVESKYMGFLNVLKTSASIFANTTVTITTSIDDTLNNKAVQNLGGTATNITINSGGIQNVNDSAKVIGGTVNDGTQNINSKGTATGVILQNSGIQNISKSGQAVSTTIDGGVQYVLSGGTSLASVIKNGGVQEVEGGAVITNGALKTTIENGGVQNILAGATISGYRDATAIDLNSGGIQNVYSGATLTSAVNLNGGTQNVFGGSVTLKEFSAGVQNVSGGKVTIGQSGINGGTQNIYANGVVTEGHIRNGGQQNIYSGAIGSMLAMTDTGSEQNIYDGGKAILNHCSAGAIQTVYTGGSATIGMDGGRIQDGIQSIQGGIGSILNGGYGVQNINGGTGYWDDMGRTLTNAQTAVQNITAGLGSASNLTSRGTQNVFGGSAIANVVELGGKQIITEGAGTIKEMKSGGTQSIAAGGYGYIEAFTQSNPVSRDNGGEQNIDGGIGAIGELDKGGIQRVSNGGTAIADRVYSQATQLIDGGVGYVKLLDGPGTNQNQGMQIIKNGSGYAEEIFQGEQHLVAGIASAGAIGREKDGGHYSGHQVVSGGTGYADQIVGAGQQTVSGGTAIAKQILHKGAQHVSGGTGLVDELYANQHIYAGAVSGYTETIASGGVQSISGAIGVANTILSGGKQIVGAGTADVEGKVGTIDGGLQDIVHGVGSAGIVTNSGIQQIAADTTGDAGLLTASGKQVVAVQGTGTVAAINGGIQEISGTGSAEAIYNTGLQTIKIGGIGTVEHIYIGGTQNIEVGGKSTQANIDGGLQLVSGQAENTTINGGIQRILANGSASNTTLNNGLIHIASTDAAIENITMNGGQIVLGSMSTTRAVGEYSIGGTLTANGGVVNMVNMPDGSIGGSFDTLNINELKGDTTVFRMDVDLDKQSGDRVHIQNATNSNTGLIQINNLGPASMSSDQKLLLVTDETESVKFSGTFYNAGGLWEVKPTVENGTVLQLDGKDWYLTGLERKVNSDTQVLLGTHDNSYAMWRNTNDSMRKHFGDVRRSGLKQGGLWARTLQGKFGSSGFDSNYSMYQLGIDRFVNDKSVYGMAIEHGTGRVNYYSGSGEDDLTAFSLYGIWYGDSGQYTNLTGRFGTLKSDVSTYGNYPDKLRSRSNAYSVSIEHGKTIGLKHNFFVEPQLQLTLGRLGSMNYTTDRGHVGAVEAMNSIIGRLGVVVGKKTPEGDELYLTASLLREFAGKRNVSMSGGGDSMHNQNNYRETWYELGFGTNIRMSKTSHFYAEFDHSFGGNIQKKWQIDAGIRVEF